MKRGVVKKKQKKKCGRTYSESRLMRVKATRNYVEPNWGIGTKIYFAILNNRAAKHFGCVWVYGAMTKTFVWTALNVVLHQISMFSSLQPKVVQPSNYNFGKRSNPLLLDYINMVWCMHLLSILPLLSIVCVASICLPNLFCIHCPVCSLLCVAFLCRWSWRAVGPCVVFLLLSLLFSLHFLSFFEAFDMFSLLYERLLFIHVFELRWAWLDFVFSAIFLCVLVVGAAGRCKRRWKRRKHLSDVFTCKKMSGQEVESFVTRRPKKTINFFFLLVYPVGNNKLVLGLGSLGLGVVGFSFNNLFTY